MQKSKFSFQRRNNFKKHTIKPENKSKKTATIVAKIVK